jgi:hypothetical protein
MPSADAPTASAEKWSDRVGAAWQRFWFTPADPLPLAILRILAGAIALYTLATYTPDLVRFFGHDGLLPVATVHRLRGDYPGWSPLELLSSPGELYAVHAVALAAAACMTIGLFTRVTTVLTLVAVLAYVHRATMVTSQLEPILIFVLLYLCFAPAGAWLSLDAGWMRRKLRDRPNQLAEWETKRTSSVAATIVLRLLQVQLALVYLLMAMAKINDGVVITGENDMYFAWSSGEAVWWMAAKPESRLVDLTWMITNQPLILNAWTHAIVLFEPAMGTLIWFRPFRPVLLVISMFMWTLLALITGFTPFCAMMFVAGVVFLPPSMLHRWLARGESR